MNLLDFVPVVMFVVAALALFVAWRSSHTSSEALSTSKRSIEQSEKALAVTRAYNDPVFVMACKPMDIEVPAEMTFDDSAKIPVALVLVNKGKSFAKNVTITANFDPFNLSFQTQAWDFIEGNGDQVDVQNPWQVDWIACEGLGELIGRADAASKCTVTYTTQSGEVKTDQVRLPNPFDYTVPSMRPVDSES